MAGAGYKLFNSGDVLTAAQVNTYLMEQTVMVFNDAAARTTALSGVLSEGMISYLKDTNATEVYNGSAWVGITGDGDITGVTAGTGISGGGTTGTVTITNDMATTITAKGDIVAGTGNATYDNLAVGNSGDTLVADSSATTGLRWQGQFMAGKNAIINGDFRINQRNFSSSTSSDVFGFDRWKVVSSNGTTTYSAQTFTLGAAPVSGYEGTNFARVATTGQTATSAFSILRQPIESVRTFANQTITVSFWAKANSGSPKIAVELEQYFGFGGSPSSSVFTYAGQATLNQNWARYSLTVALPSISGKTLGTDGASALNLNFWVSAGTDFNARSGSLGIQTNTFDIWGVQVEAGSVATPFTTATGTLAGELQACQRYYYRISADANNPHFGHGYNTSTTGSNIYLYFPQTMRVAPTLSSSAAGTFFLQASGINNTPTAIAFGNVGTNTAISTLTGTSLTSYAPSSLVRQSGTAFIEGSAEL